MNRHANAIAGRLSLRRPHPLRRPAALALAALLSFAARAETEPNVIPPDAAAALHEARSAVLYSLEPWTEKADADPRLHGFKILGQTNIDGEALRIAAGEFEAAVARSEKHMSACFDPRHAIRVVAGGHEYDFLLCYACHQLVVYRDGKDLDLLGAAGSAKPLNALLTAAGVPVSVSYDEDAEAARAKQYEADHARWLAARPKSLAEFEVDGFPGASRDTLLPLANALAKEYPDERERILALYAWYGSGAGPWSGYPAYEDVPQGLLLRFSTERRIAAIESTEASEAQLEGAARLFGGGSFRRSGRGI